MPTLYIDGDACPVKAETIRIAERHNLIVFLVSNSGMRTGTNPNVKNVMVSDGADAADDWIAEHIEAGDIAITADIPLAARCLEKSAQVLGPTGRAFTPENIGSALASRELNQHLRETGIMTGGNAQFSKADRSRFMNQLEQAIRKPA